MQRVRTVTITMFESDMPEGCETALEDLSIDEMIVLGQVEDLGVDDADDRTFA